MKKPSLSEITPETIDGWKKQFGKVFKFSSEDGKAGFFKTPDRNTMDASSALAKNNPVKSNEVLAKACFLGGDEELLTSDAHFFGLSSQLSKLMEVKQGELAEC